MAAAGLWEGRHILAKAAAAIAALFLLPVMFILMLPSLIFGSNGLNDVPANVLNDNTVIMANIAEVETGIEAILREKHDAVLRQIEAEANGLGSNCEYSITDDFSDRIIYESALIISQFCASQADYQEVKLSKLEQILRAGTDGIFSYTVDVTSWTETDPETGASETYYHYEYTM